MFILIYILNYTDKCLENVPELPPDTFLRKVKRASDGFAVPPPHHVRPVSLSQLQLQPS